jgi:hypothetical protein
LSKAVATVAGRENCGDIDQTARREDGEADPSVTQRDPRPNRRHPRLENPPTQRLLFSTETPNRKIKETADARERHLDQVFAGLIDTARQYSDELIRPAKLHTARLKTTAGRVLLLIRRVRELMPDWSITHEDVLRWVEQQKWLKLLH